MPIQYDSEISKCDGLDVMQASLQRHQADKGLLINILEDQDFWEAGRWSRGKLGMGKKANAEVPLTPEEEEGLWTCGILGIFCQHLLYVQCGFCLHSNLGCGQSKSIRV